MMNSLRTLFAAAGTLALAIVSQAQNPLNLGSKILTADPSGHVWADGKMYLYTSHDEECQEDFWMKDWHVFSSSDLVTWKDHGAVLSVKDLKWADNYAWAPDAAYKNGKYYFCFPVGTGHKDRVNPKNSTKWMGIGIAESDSPTGPFKDVIGGPLWTEPYANDPCLFVDDDGRTYLYFHGGGDYMVREMADDMRSVKGEFVKMDMGGYEPKMEGPWVFKRKGVYYFTMPENNRKLTYYMSHSPTGPWKYQGVIMEEEGGRNNHHSIVEFKGQWILFYHRWLKTDSPCGKPQRHVCAEYLYFNEDGTIQEVKRTTVGVGSPSSRAITSIILQELEPGICDPVMFEAKGTGYTGAGYINTPNDKAARITWSVKSPAGGPHKLEIRFANGGKDARSGVLEINGGANGMVDVALPVTGSFAQWETATLDVTLVGGENSISLQAITDGGLPNIDYLKVTGANPSPGDCGEPASTARPSAPVDFSYLNTPPVGWVTQGDGVTGGGNARPVVVRTMSELQTQAAGEEPRVIHVDGQLRGMLTVGSNKTIIGRQGAEIASDGRVLHLPGSRNVIIKNLTLLGMHKPNQPNTILHDVKNVWLDHNSFINSGTDLLVVSGTSDFVTLSWNVFRQSIFAHNHTGVNIGLSDNDTTSRGHLRVTLHHNFYAKLVNERMPRVRFGQVHAFNNLCLAGTDPQSRSYYAVRPGVDANIRSERNIYKDFVGPSWWWTSEKLGAETSTVFNYARGNENSVLESIEDVAIPEAVKGPIAIKEHEGVTGQAGFYGNGKAFDPPYAYTADPTAGLEEKIRAGAGAR